MRILVCGGRTFDKQDVVFQELDARNDIHPITLIIEGGAVGADRHARFWALSKGVPCITVHAAWDTLGKAAGPVRNEWMIKYGQPDICLAFPGGAGTRSMKRIALSRGVTLTEAR